MIFAAILLASLSSEPREPKIPTRFTCVVVRALYKHYAKTYSQDDMEAFLRAKNISEEKIALAKKCIS